MKDLNFLLIKIDAGVYPDIIKALTIDPLPIFIIHTNGKKTWRKERIAMKKELLAASGHC